MIWKKLLKRKETRDCRQDKRHLSIGKFSNLKIILPLFILFFIFYLCSLFRFDSILTNQEHAFFSDTKEIAESMRGITFRKDMVKHLLFSLTTSPPVSLMKTLTPLDENQSILVVLALFAALNTIAAYLTLKLFLGNELLALLFSLFFGFSLSNLIYFSFPETYIVTELVIIIYFYFLVRFRSHLTLKKTAVFFVITCLAPFYNPPLFLLLIPTGYIYYKNFKLKKFLITFLGNILFVAAVFSIPYFFIPFFILPSTAWASYYDIMYPIEYMKEWASLSHFTSLKHIANTTGNFLFFSLISPFQELRPPSNFLVDFFSYFGSVIGTISIIIYTGFLSLTGFHVFRKRSKMIDATLLFFISMIFFYIYFNPYSPLLYSSQVVFPLVLIFSYVLKDVERRIKYVFLILFLLIVIINNILSLYSPSIIVHIETLSL